MSEKSRILIVDDNPMNVDILRHLLRKNYELESAEEGESAFALIPSFRPTLVLLDIMMPGLNGYEVCRKIKESPVGEFTQVILVSGKASASERINGYEVGADDYVVKPFDHEELLSKVRVQCRLHEVQVKLMRAKQELEIYNVELSNLVEQRTVEVIATRDMTVFALAQLAESRDSDTGEHLFRMRAYSQILAEHLHHNPVDGYLVDEDFLADLYRASPLHDIGKVGIADSILCKPGKLTAGEREEMQRHVLFGAKTLRQAMNQGSSGEFLAMAADVTRYHHERWNGEGYCEGLSGTDIPLAARIVALADVFDALTSLRVYKSPFPVEQAREMIEEESGQHFDPVIVDAFRNCFPEFLKIMRQYNGAAVELEGSLPPEVAKETAV